MLAPKSGSCRGFTHPLVLLVRSSLNGACIEQQQFASRAWSRSGAGVSSRAPSGTRSATSSAAPKKTASTQHVSRTIPPTSTKAPPKPTTATATTTTTVTPDAAATKQPVRVPVQTNPSPHMGFAQTLARNSTPTTLYEGPPQRVFLLSSYAAGVTLFGAGVVNAIFNVYHLPEGVPGWLVYPFGAASIMFAVLGTRFAMTPAGIVRTIKVLPLRETKTSKPQIEVMVRRTTPIPGLPLQRIVCEPSDIVMKSRMYNKPTVPTALERARRVVEEAERKRAELEYERTHIMSAPFRHGWWAIKTAFSSIRQGIIGEGFAPVTVKGIKYKLDITDGYALEDGRALDTIVQIDEDPRLAALRASAAAARSQR